MAWEPRPALTLASRSLGFPAEAALMMAKTVAFFVVGVLAFGCNNAPTGGAVKAEPSLIARAVTRLSGYQWQRVKSVVRSKFRLERIGKVKPATRSKPRTSRSALA